MYILLVGLGGALGSILRYLVGNWAQSRWASQWPVGTWLVNVAGCLLIGFVFGYLQQKTEINNLRLLLMTGFCGGFTTLSTFSMETLALWQSGQSLMALAYVLASVVVCILAVGCGMWLMR
jgi:fluoride exporter